MTGIELGNILAFDKFENGWRTHIEEMLTITLQLWFYKSTFKRQGYKILKF